jgi:hypothetical protein
MDNCLNIYIQFRLLHHVYDFSSLILRKYFEILEIQVLPGGLPTGWFTLPKEIISTRN